jgi:glycosyltransferase involved in cell wall biosynthesis
MLAPVKVSGIELSRPPCVEAAGGYASLQALARLHGSPIGYVQLPAGDRQYTAAALTEAIVEQHAPAILDHLLRDWLASQASKDPAVADLLNSPHPPDDGRLPLVTVAVCTRDRAADLERCLDSIMGLDYPSLDIVVIDNAPSSDATWRLVSEGYPRARYVRETRPGLNWARNRAIAEALGEIIAYTDDDVVVDAGWVKAIARLFVENPEVMAVTGLVAPYELETEAQILFEKYGGFGRGFKRKWYWFDPSGRERAAAVHGGAGKVGTGANMAYRRSLFDRVGRFDTALDVGTVTNGGGDLEMFFRVLKEGHALVYEPCAVVLHRHRRDYAQLRTQLANNGIGFYSYIVRSALHYKDERFAFARLGLWWFWWWNIRRLLISFLRPQRFPRDLIIAELRGSLKGLTRYHKSRRIAAKIASSFARAEQAGARPCEGREL